MKHSLLFVFLVAIILSGCADVPSHLTSNEYAAACHYAERKKLYSQAEQHCYFALATNDWGGNQQTKSRRLHNLALVKQKLGKHYEAELLFKEALQIEETAISKSLFPLLIGLSDSLANQNKWSEGAQILSRALAISEQASSQEQIFASHLYTLYSEQLYTSNQPILAKQFKKAGIALGTNTTYVFR